MNPFRLQGFSYCLLFLVCQAGLLQAQTPPPDGPPPNQPLIVSLSTKLMQPEESVVWIKETVKGTISGQTVSVKMTGENVVIFARITPFYQNENSILLIAQGEVFFSGTKQGNRYHTSIKSLAVTPGEKVIFFPLGRMVDPESDLYYIEMEIQVQPGTTEEAEAS